MPKELTIDVDDLKVVMKEWLDQPTSERANPEDVDLCAEWLFSRLESHVLEQPC